MGLSAQVLDPGALGLPGWQVGDPVEVKSDGEGGLWVRGRAGVLAVDGRLRPRPWAAAMFFGTAGGLGWEELEPGWFLAHGAGGARLFHAEIPQGLSIPAGLEAGGATPDGPDLQAWLEGAARFHGASSFLPWRGGWAAAGPGWAALYDAHGTQTRRWELDATGPVFLVPVGEDLALVDGLAGTLRLLEGNSEGVVWNLAEAAEAQAADLEARGRGAALETLALGMLPFTRQRTGSSGGWDDRVALGRSLRAGFSEPRLRFKAGVLDYRLIPDDGNTNAPLLLTVESVPSGILKSSLRDAPWRGRLEVGRAPVLRLEIRRGDEVQEAWVLEEQ